ncbi:MAG: hypothetical protein RL181_2893 [Bacteroidota bacterium]
MARSCFFSLHPVACRKQRANVTSVYLVFFLFLLPLAGCQPKEGAGGVQTPSTGKGYSNADLIRNPVSAEGEQSGEALAVLEFAEFSYEFGNVESGKVIDHSFPFTNTGTVPLLIGNASSSCGCTVPEWPQAPIPPGGKGVVRVRFDTQGKTGEQRKPVFITANTYPANTTLYLVGEVSAKKGP